MRNKIERLSKESKEPSVLLDGQVVKLLRGQANMTRAGLAHQMGNDDVGFYLKFLRMVEASDSIEVSKSLAERLATGLNLPNPDGLLFKPPPRTPGQKE